MYYDPDMLLLMMLLMFVVIIVAAANVANDMGGMGWLLILIGILFGWPFAAIGAVLVIAHYHDKRNKK